MTLQTVTIINGAMIDCPTAFQLSNALKNAATVIFLSCMYPFDVEMLKYISLNAEDERSDSSTFTGTQVAN